MNIENLKPLTNNPGKGTKCVVISDKDKYDAVVGEIVTINQNYVDIPNCIKADGSTSNYNISRLALYIEEPKIKPNFEAVKCDNQDQFNFVLKTLKYNRLQSKEFAKYNCINIKEEDANALEDCQMEGNKVYTFREWCSEFKIFYKPKEMSKDEILAKAKKDYPIGTRFNCVKNGDKAIVEKELQYCSSTDNIYTMFKGSGFNQYVYAFGEWAEIISLPESKPESLVGRYVKALIDYPNGGLVKRDEIGKIIKEPLKGNYYADFPSQQNYNLLDSNIGNVYNLMPIDFNPEQSKPVEPYSVGGWVKCIKSGNFKGALYLKDNYYKISNTHSKHTNPHVYIDINGEDILISTKDDNSYGKECEWVGMELPNNAHLTGKQIDNLKLGLGFFEQIKPENIYPSTFPSFKIEDFKPKFIKINIYVKPNQPKKKKEFLPLTIRTIQKIKIN